MKKLLTVMICIVLMLSLLTGCCRHVWYAATCVAPQTCQECGKTEGEALGHTWVEATCTTPKTCSVCNQTEGEAPGHTWQEATTEAPQTCSVCQLTEGEKINTDPRFTTDATKEIQGKWTCDTVLNYAEMLGVEGYLEEVEVTLIYEFKNNGDLVQTIEVHDQLAFIDGMKKFTADVLYASMAQQGISKAQTDAAIQQEFGMTTEEYINKEVESMDYEELFEGMVGEGVYYVTDGKVWMGNSWLNEFESSEYTLENGILIIEEDVPKEGAEPYQWKKAE